MSHRQNHAHSSAAVPISIPDPPLKPAVATEEGRPAASVLVLVFLFGTIFAVQCCVTVLSQVTRDTIFLKVWGPAFIPYMTVLVSFTTAYTSTCAPVLTASVGGITVACSLFACLSGLVMLSCWLLLASLPVINALTSAVFYVWVEVSVQLSVQYFWELCSLAFDIRQSKKYFGTIAFGSTLGTLFTGFVIIPSLRRYEFSTEFNVLVVACLLQVVAALLFYLAPVVAHYQRVTVRNDADSRHESTRKTSKGTVDNSSSSNYLQMLSGRVSEIMYRRYLSHICVFELSATILRVLVDFQTLSVLAKYSEEDMKSTLGIINGVQSCLMMPLQLVATPLFSQFGVMYGIAVMPLASIGFGLITAVSTNHIPFIVARGMYNSVTYSIFNTAKELQWLPLNDSDRAKTKPFIYGPFRAGARIVGAVLSMALTMYGDDSTAIIGAIIVCLSTAWFSNALSAKEAYAAEFYSSLKRGYLDLTSPHIDITPDQIQLIKHTLLTGEQTQIRFVLNALAPHQVSLFAKELRAMFYKETRDNTTFRVQLQNNSAQNGSNKCTSRTPTTSQLKLKLKQKQKQSQPVVPMHTKLKLLELHVLSMQNEQREEPKNEYFSLFHHHSRSSLEPRKSQLHNSAAGGKTSARSCGIFSAADLLMLVNDRSAVSCPRQIRTSAVLCCGYERDEDEKQRCVTPLRRLLSQLTDTTGNSNTTTREDSYTLVISLCIALLKLTNWTEQRAHIELVNLLYDEKNVEIKASCLRSLGRELPDLVGNGYLLHAFSHQNVEQKRSRLSSEMLLQTAALDFTRDSKRTAAVLVPAFISKLSQPTLRSHIIETVEHFDPVLLYGHLAMGLERAVEIRDESFVVGAVHLIRTKLFPSNVATDVVITLLEYMLLHTRTTTDPCDELEQDTIPIPIQTANVLDMYEGDAWHISTMEEVVETLIQVFDSTESSTSTCEAFVRRVHDLVHVILAKIYALKYLLAALDPTDPITQCDSHCDSQCDSQCGSTKPLLLVFINQTIRALIHVALKLTSLSFPSHFHVNLILEGLDSGAENVVLVLQEVLETICPSEIKPVLFPLLFHTSYTPTAIALQMEKQAAAQFEHTTSFKQLNQWIQSDNEPLACLSLDFLLRFHTKELVETSTAFFWDVCLERKLTRDLLLHSEQILKGTVVTTKLERLKRDTQHHQHELNEDPQLGFTVLDTTECLSSSTLLMSVNIMELLERVAPVAQLKRVERGGTFVREGDLGDTMYVIASGQVVLHRAGQTLATLSAGDCVGQLALMQYHSHAGKHLASATVVSDSDCCVLGLSRDLLDQLMLESSQVARAVLDAMASALKWSYIEPLMVNSSSSVNITQNGNVATQSKRKSKSKSQKNQLLFRSSSMLNLRVNESTRSEWLRSRQYALASEAKVALNVAKVASTFLQLVGRSGLASNLSPSKQSGIISTAKQERARMGISCTSPRSSRTLPPQSSRHRSGTTTESLSASSSSYKSVFGGDHSVGHDLNHHTRRFFPGRKHSVSVCGTVQYSKLEICIHLKGSKLLRDLNDNNVSLVAQLVHVEEYSAGQFVFQEGDAATALYILVTGCVDVLMERQKSHQEHENPNRINSSSSTETFNEQLEPGSCFGEVSLVKEASHIGSAMSLGRSEVLVLPRTALIELAEKHIDVLHAILSWLAHQITLRTAKLVDTRSAESHNNAQTQLETQPHAYKELSVSVEDDNSYRDSGCDRESDNKTVSFT